VRRIGIVDVEGNPLQLPVNAKAFFIYLYTLIGLDIDDIFYMYKELYDER